MVLHVVLSSLLLQSYCEPFSQGLQNKKDYFPNHCLLMLTALY